MTGIAQHELERMLAGGQFDAGLGLTRSKMKMGFIEPIAQDKSHLHFGPRSDPLQNEDGIYLARSARWDREVR